MQAVVTGVAGFIGAGLAEQLLSDGWRVRGIDRLSDYYDPALKEHNVERLAGHGAFEFVEEDLNDSDLDLLLAGAEVVHHLAAQPGVRMGWGADFELYLRDNVLATQRLLDAARHSRDLRRLVFASSSSIYGNAGPDPMDESREPHPISPYGATKLAGEHLCRLYGRQGHGVPTVILRYFTVFGPGQRPDMAISRFLDAALEERPIEVFGDGRQARDFTYIDDVVAATMAAGDRGRPGATYNIAGGTHATVLELIAMIGSLLGRSPSVVHLPGAAGDVRNTAGDKTRARRDLGFEGRTSLEAGLARQLEARLRAVGAVARVTELFE